jgi:hypothetical protein
VIAVLDETPDSEYAHVRNRLQRTHKTTPFVLGFKSDRTRRTASYHFLPSTGNDSIHNYPYDLRHVLSSCRRDCCLCTSTISL